MASRRDELNAYTFAKKRLVAQFLQPSPTGTEEGAPRPLRAVVPGLIIGVVIMAGFGAWGMFKPQAPEKWDDVGKNIIIGSESTTRYVVLKTGKGKAQLHPVLNLASAKLLVNENSGDPVKVAEKILDNSKLRHGATLGIPYAPDRLPSKDEAEAAKRWVVCERPGTGGRAIQRAAFVFGERDENKVEGRNKLRNGELMYVVGPGPTNRHYVVDKDGTAHQIDPTDRKLLTQVVGPNREPQRVSQDWLSTLHAGKSIHFPHLSGVGDPTQVKGLPPAYSKIGVVLKTSTATRDQQYVVMRNKVAPVTDFVGKLLLNGPDAEKLRLGPTPKRVVGYTVDPGDPYVPEKGWPKQTGGGNVNSPRATEGSRNTACNVLRKIDDKNNTTLSTWVGKDFPAQLPSGSSSGYVTPGSGQLFRQVQGHGKSGQIFLVTDTGLRYAMQGNGDSDKKKSGSGDNEKRKSKQQVQREAEIKLGFGDVIPRHIPADWADFLPTGPRLSSSSAKQPQGS